jgi:hypothetical protein
LIFKSQHTHVFTITFFLYRYALGGYDGSTMVPSIEIFDPRLGSWRIGEPMKNPRGYFAAGAVKESICVIGGIRVGENIVDTVSYILPWFPSCTICFRTNSRYHPYGIYP